MKSGAAKWHGAQFANQGLGCLTYLWPESPDHHVFFFARDGVFYGEYRDEHLKAGRFLEVTEHYLTKDTRSLEGSVRLDERLELPFVRKTTTLLWENDVWVASTVTWQFLTCSRDGMVMRSEPPEVIKTVRREVTLVVPERQFTKPVEYYAQALRPETSPYEEAFGAGLTRQDEFSFGMQKLADGRCTFRLEWPESRPAIVFELHERVPNPPRDANPEMVRTVKVASMLVKALPGTGSPVVFEP